MIRTESASLVCERKFNKTNRNRSHNLQSPSGVLNVKLSFFSTATKCYYATKRNVVMVAKELSVSDLSRWGKLYFILLQRAMIEQCLPLSLQIIFPLL